MHVSTDQSHMTYHAWYPTQQEVILIKYSIDLRRNPIFVLAQLCQVYKWFAYEHKAVLASHHQMTYLKSNIVPIPIDSNVLTTERAILRNLPWILLDARILPVSDYRNQMQTSFKHQQQLHDYVCSFADDEVYEYEGDDEHALTTSRKEWNTTVRKW